MQDNPFRWFFDCDCLHHQYHLLVKGLLIGLDLFILPALGLTFKYYTALASFMHVLGMSEVIR